MYEKKFLISAYGCEPNKGSEPGIGWHWSLQLVQFGTVFIITRSNNRPSIEEGLARLPKDIADKLHFIYYDTNSLIRKMKKGDHNLYAYYFFWQIGAYKLAARLCRDIRFDYCVSLTFGSVWMPTFMYKLKVPFIWGPIGGGEAIPDVYIPLMSRMTQLTDRVRKLMIKTISINPLVSLPVKRAAYIIVRTEDTAKILPGKYKNKVFTCLETAIDLTEIIPKDYEKDSSNEKTILIYTGRLIKSKGLELVLQAISKSSCKSDIEFWIIGTGDQKSSLEKLAKSLNIHQCIKFVGKIERKKLLETLKMGDIYIFPSFKEGGTWALMEAMGTALPVICLDTSGMHIITNDKCAIRIPVGSIDETIQEYTLAIERL